MNGHMNWKSLVLGAGLVVFLLAAPLFLSRLYIYFFALVS